MPSFDYVMRAEATLKADIQLRALASDMKTADNALQADINSRALMSVVQTQKADNVLHVLASDVKFAQLKARIDLCALASDVKAADFDLRADIKNVNNSFGSEIKTLKNEITLCGLETDV